MTVKSSQAAAAPLAAAAAAAAGSLAPPLVALGLIWAARGCAAARASLLASALYRPARACRRPLGAGRMLAPGSGRRAQQDSRRRRRPTNAFLSSSPLPTLLLPRAAGC